MNWKDCPLVETHPQKLGGAPLIKDTRVPVSAILNNHDGGSSNQEIAENFGLAVEQVRTILEFADRVSDTALGLLKILFDQNVARALRKFTPGHITFTADEMRWSKLINGDLLQEAERNAFDIFVTADKNIRYQQNLKGRKISIIELSTNDWNILKTLPDRYISAVESTVEGGYQTIAYPLPPLRPRRQR